MASSASSLLSSTSRMSISSEFTVSPALDHTFFSCRGRLHSPRVKSDRAPRSNSASAGTPALVLFDDSLHGGQSHTGAFEVFLAVQALKDSKELIGILHTEPDSVVANKMTESPSMSICPISMTAGKRHRGDLEGIGSRIWNTFFVKVGSQ